MSNLDKLWKKGKDFLGVEYPIISGGMSWVSNYELVKAVSDSGGFPVLAGGNMPPEVFDVEVEKCKKGLNGKPFAVNVVTIAPYYREQMKILVDKQVPFCVFAGNFPKKQDVEVMKKGGTKVMAFATTVQTAKQMLRYGVDALIIEGMEAGGHIGTTALSVLIQEVLFAVKDECPVFVAGGIASGKMIAHLLLMGAAGVQMGTRFVMCEECTAHEDFKKIFARAKSRDAVVSPQMDKRLPIVPVRALKNKGMEEFNELQKKLIGQLDEGTLEREAAVLEIEGYWMGALRKGVVDGDLDSGSLMAGQSVGLMKDIKPMKEIMDEIVKEAEEEMDRIKSLLG